MAWVSGHDGGMVLMKVRHKGVWTELLLMNLFFVFFAVALICCIGG